MLKKMPESEISASGRINDMQNPLIVKGNQEEPNSKMYIREYRSTIDSNLKLTAEFYVPSKPKPLCLFFHGWHMTAKGSRLQKGTIEPLIEEFFLVNVDMRGRGGSSGKADASGHELVDGLDALDYARKHWKDKISSQGLYTVGGSGGGGNVLTTVGKAPDIFSAAVSWAGMSDYAVWYNSDTRGKYRDEMEDKNWIGGNPNTNPEGYRSRSGLSIIENVLTKFLVIHGKKDGSVPVISAELYDARSQQLKKTNITVHYNDKGHSSMDWPLALKHLRENKILPEIPKKGRFLVHSFLALRSFWLILENPSDMGYVDYSLDSENNLQNVIFYRTHSRKNENNYRLRIFSHFKEVLLKDDLGNNIYYIRETSESKRYSDYLFKCKNYFNLTVLK